MIGGEQDLPDGYEWFQTRVLSVGSGHTTCEGITRSYSVTRTRDPNKTEEQQLAEMRVQLRRMQEDDTFGDGAGI